MILHSSMGRLYLKGKELPGFLPPPIPRPLLSLSFSHYRREGGIPTTRRPSSRSWYHQLYGLHPFFYRRLEPAMPNPATHIQMAYRAAQKVDAPILVENMECYLVGSTAPDVRVITGQERELYHFASLDFEAAGAGVAGMFGRYPELRTTSHRPTRSFVAGYITHLVLDETWITKMYRPFFGAGGIFETEQDGAVMDRVMQMHLDCIAMREIDGLRTRLAGFDGSVHMPFIDRGVLVDWREWVTNFLEQGFSWDRLRFMARRISRGDESHAAHRIADEFIRGMPDTLDELHRLIPESTLREFERAAIDEMAARVAEHLA